MSITFKQNLKSLIIISRLKLCSNWPTTSCKETCKENFYWVVEGCDQAPCELENLSFVQFFYIRMFKLNTTLNINKFDRDAYPLKLIKMTCRRTSGIFVLQSTHIKRCMSGSEVFSPSNQQPTLSSLPRLNQIHCTCTHLIHRQSQTNQ